MQRDVDGIEYHSQGIRLRLSCTMIRIISLTLILILSTAGSKFAQFAYLIRKSRGNPVAIRLFLCVSEFLLQFLIPVPVMPLSPYWHGTQSTAQCSKSKNITTTKASGEKGAHSCFKRRNKHCEFAVHAVHVIPGYKYRQAPQIQCQRHPNIKNSYWRGYWESSEQWLDYWEITKVVPHGSTANDGTRKQCEPVRQLEYDTRFYELVDMMDVEAVCKTST